MSRAWKGWVGATLVLVCLLAGRWSALFARQTASVSEAQAVAASLGLPQDLTSMWGPSANEGGPLASWALVPLRACGLSPDYLAARVTTLLLDWAALLLAYRLLRARWSRRTTALVLLPPVLILALWRGPALAAYSPAHLAAPLVLFGLWRLGRCGHQLQTFARVRWGTAIASGVALGALPCVSRNAAVIAVLPCCWHVWRAWREDQMRPSQRFEVLKPVGVALYMVIAVLAGLHGTGQFERFWFAYTGGDRTPVPPRESLTVIPRLIREIGRPDVLLAVWGGQPQLHAATALRKGAIYSGAEVPREVERREFLARAFVDDFRQRKPVFFVQAAELPRDLAAELQLYYCFIRAELGLRLYARMEWMHSAGRFARIGLVPLDFTATRTGSDHIMAHAPSRLVHRVPAEAKRLRGRYGFEPGAYLRPTDEGTDGAVFRIELTGHDGRRTKVLEQRLSPMYVEAERGVFDFSIELPAGQVAEVTLTVEAGETAIYDWTYWEELRFETEIYDSR